jgi:dihydrofolate synthase/folylpolyglutamate synthase
LIFTRPEAERSAHPEVLAAVLPAAEREKAVCVADVGAALAEARRITDADDLICVAGSLYLIGAVRRLLLGDLVG